jgi:DNA gyrase subunit A
VKGRPKLLNLKQLISNFVEHRHEVVIRRTQYELDQAEKKAHILEGLMIALDNLDEVISLIRSSKTPEEARNGLMARFELSEEQARAILEMRLQKLTGLERDKVKRDYEELQKFIAYLKEVLADESIRMNIIKEELDELKEQFGDERKTEIQLDAEEFNPEDFYADEDVLITISHMGYIKRMSLNEFRTQNRGGVGARGGKTRDNDFLEHMFIANMHNTLMLFTEKGKCFWLKVYEIPEGSRSTKGRAIQNLINIEPEDNIKAFINAESLKDEEYINNNYILMCTKKGVVKKTKLEAYSRPRTNGVNAITIKEGDQLLEAKLTDGISDIILATREGKAIRFNENDVRSIGRTGSGVRGITLGSEDDEVIGMVWIEQGDNELLVVSEKGYGKRSGVDDYRTINRGGKGVKTFGISDKTGHLVGIKGVSDEVDIMIITRQGVTIRVDVADIRVTGRTTQGVRLINLRKNDTIAAVTQVSKTDEEEAVALADEQEESGEEQAPTNSEEPTEE